MARLIGTDRLARLRKVWRDAHATADTDARTMLKLGRRWCRILGIEPDTPPERNAPGNRTSTSPVAEAVKQAAAEIAAAAIAELTPPPAIPPGKTAKRQAENTARQNAALAASQVFSGNPAGGATGASRDPRDAKKGSGQEADPRPARRHRR